MSRPHSYTPGRKQRTPKDGRPRDVRASVVCPLQDVQPAPPPPTQLPTVPPVPSQLPPSPPPLGQSLATRQHIAQLPLPHVSSVQSPPTSLPCGVRASSLASNTGGTLMGVPPTVSRDEAVAPAQVLACHGLPVTAPGRALQPLCATGGVAAGSQMYHGHKAQGTRTVHI